MGEIIEEHGIERLARFLQFGQLTDEVIRDPLVTVVGGCSRSIRLQMGHALEDNAGEGRILQRGTGVDAYVVAFVQECVDEGRTDMAALHTVPIDRRHTEEHAEDGIARTVGTAEMVVVPLIVHGKLPGHGHRFLGQRVHVPRVNEYEDNIRSLGVGDLQWVQREVDIAFSHIRVQHIGRMLQSPFLQRTSSLQWKIIGNHTRGTDNGTALHKDTVGMQTVGYQQTAHQASGQTTGKATTQTSLARQPPESEDHEHKESDD